MNADSKDPSMIEKYPFATLEKVIITPILSAIIEKDYTKLKKLLELENKLPNCGTVQGFTPLHFAAEIDDCEAAEILIQHGADANARYVSHLPKDLIPRFIEQNSTPDLHVITPLFIAMKHNHYDIMVVLLRAGRARMDFLSQKGRRKFMWLNYIHWVLFELILPHVDELNEPNELGINLLYKAVTRYDHRRQLKLLLKYGADPNFRYPEGNVPLILAVFVDNDVALNMLCTYGADLEAVNDKGHTALYTIAESGYKPNWFINNIDRPVIYENRKRSSNIFKTLLCLGANPNVCDKNGWTVFDRAVGINDDSAYKSDFDEDLIEWLLIYGVEWKNAKIDFLDQKQWIRAKERIVEYHVKRQLAGLNFKTDILIEGKDLLKEGFREQCIAELEKMKTWLLFENMTMHKFLRCSSKRSLVSVSSQEEVKQIDKGLYKIEFPIYKNLLERNFKKGKMYVPIYKRAYDDLDSLCNNRLPKIVIDKIIDLLNVTDINNIKKITEKYKK